MSNTNADIKFNLGFSSKVQMLSKSLNSIVVGENFPCGFYYDLGHFRDFRISWHIIILYQTH